MSKVTSKLQVTLPKAIADRYGVGPGSDVVFEPAGESIRVLVYRFDPRFPRSRSGRRVCWRPRSSRAR